MSALANRSNTVADAIVTQLAAWPALAGIPVYNGQDPALYDTEDAIAVAASEDPDGNGDVMRYTASWAAIGTTRAEEGDITCVLVSQRGEPSATAKVVRDRAHDLLSEVERCLHTDNGQLGGTVPGLLWVHVSEASYTVAATTQGFGVQIRFVVSYKGRFGPFVS